MNPPTYVLLHHRRYSSHTQYTVQVVSYAHLGFWKTIGVHRASLTYDVQCTRVCHTTRGVHTRNHIQVPCTSTTDRMAYTVYCMIDIILLYDPIKYSYVPYDAGTVSGVALLKCLNWYASTRVSYCTEGRGGFLFASSPGPWTLDIRKVWTIYSSCQFGCPSPVPRAAVCSIPYLRV